MKRYMIYLAADHAGFELKGQIEKFLRELGYEVIDMGAYEYDQADDYPDFVLSAAERVAKNPRENRAIILGGSGQGEAIAANKVKGVKAMLYYGGNLDIVKLSRQHNNTNVLSLGARFLSFDQAKEAIRVWLETEFEGGRHERRVHKIEEYEQNH
ncbi:MAG: ribose-5-phosphate isomerase [Candidatus Wildermuthbacteria bacterium RIFCSPHIGHO2_12_FULL_45_9]|uniref:Ribose-5-phosphate isomerase n=1 Tax=Candidatus Wildermuthbacteria bacterium RIFCSPHIGHO2_02_FULL_45_25 TaxID=1802450 RepID=A0A1G2R4W9_9BACT|nr:MAG: ribose-5-phosphate isomerase [Candidatus Wildermuthbacteria bacterium RIFCSPHIGHO2_01_FULL_45_20]OHA67863.1 MAG: ribose-5-phosphate isomerase [Candidatus Wildermuthbacteria bacterium RIFCSPHIGHO2_02_FULL_45_25]OHA70201.1 MAG: ribose-5-phosphate isomerase [Candidatus Wildermuthbacteria bacterium RIFCSPHIGHO2_12_FULL_45_9]